MNPFKRETKGFDVALKPLLPFLLNIEYESLIAVGCADNVNCYSVDLNKLEFCCS